MTHISNMKVIGRIFYKVIKFWRLTTEFYGVWKKVATDMHVQTYNVGYEVL